VTLMSNELVAWAAGLFDGEGSSSMYVPRARRTARRQIQVSQGATDGQLPPVLVRFREIVGVGNVTGPYRDSLYYWKTTRKDAIDLVAATLWPYLGEVKRAQFSSMSVRAGRQLPPLPSPVRATGSEASWAAGLFDGEGSVFSRDKRRPSWRGVSMELPQSSAAGTPETLTRFRSIVGVGSISGPRTQRNPWSRLPQYRWQLTGRHQVSAVVALLWPHLASVNRARLLMLREFLDAETREQLFVDTGTIESDSR
jgi:hypothetical protein